MAAEQELTQRRKDAKTQEREAATALPAGAAPEAARADEGGEGGGGLPRRVSRKEQQRLYYRDVAKEEFPAMPDSTAESLATYLSETKGVMQSEELSLGEAMRRAVRAYIRHRKTAYESNFGDDIDRGSNRAYVGKQIDAIYDEWRGLKPAKPRVPTYDELKEDPNAWSVTYSWDKTDPTKRHTGYGRTRAELETYIAMLREKYPDTDPTEVYRPNNTAASVSQSGGERQEFSKAAPIGGRRRGCHRPADGDTGDSAPGHRDGRQPAQVEALRLTDAG